MANCDRASDVIPYFKWQKLVSVVLRQCYNILDPPQTYCVVVNVIGNGVDAIPLVINFVRCDNSVQKLVDTCIRSRGKFEDP